MMGCDRDSECPASSGVERRLDPTTLQALSLNCEPNALASGRGKKNCQKQGPRLAPSAHKRMNFQLRDRA